MQQFRAEINGLLNQFARFVAALLSAFALFMVALTLGLTVVVFTSIGVGILLSASISQAASWLIAAGIVLFVLVLILVLRQSILVKPISRFVTGHLCPKPCGHGSKTGVLDLLVLGLSLYQRAAAKSESPERK